MTLAGISICAEFNSSFINSGLLNNGVSPVVGRYIRQIPTSITFQAILVENVSDLNI